MSACKWNRDTGDYLTPDGEPCRVDDYGDPTKHCTARLSCSVHIGRDELTCPRCIGRTRADVKRVVDLAALMLPMALGDGLRSAAADLAGPAADPRAVRDVKFYVSGHATHAYRTEQIDEAKFIKIMNALPDDDERHPYSVLTRWQMMLSEDYGHPLPDRLTIATAADYLTTHLGRIANDPEQDYALLAREIRKVREHLESALHDSRKPERGAPCPECLSENRGVNRMIRIYAEWWQASDDSLDRWRCPRCRDEWTHGMYEAYVAERKAI